MLLHVQNLGKIVTLHLDIGFTYFLAVWRNMRTLFEQEDFLIGIHQELARKSQARNARAQDHDIINIIIRASFCHSRTLKLNRFCHCLQPCMNCHCRICQGSMAAPAFTLRRTPPRTGHTCIRTLLWSHTEGPTPTKTKRSRLGADATVVDDQYREGITFSNGWPGVSAG